MLGVCEGVSDCEAVLVSDDVTVGLWDSEGDDVGDAVSFCEELAVVLGVEVELEVEDALGVMVDERLPLCDCVRVTERDGVEVDETVPERDWESETVRVTEGDCVDVTLGVGLCDADDVCEGTEKKSAMRRIE